MSKDFSWHVYHSRRWRNYVRPAVVARDHGLCQECLKHGAVEPGEIVHHIIELTPQNVHDQAIAYGLDNLELVCRDCHAKLHPDTKAKRSCTREGLAFDPYGNLMPV